jgi:hypothetical protein
LQAELELAGTLVSHWADITLPLLAVVLAKAVCRAIYRAFCKVIDILCLVAVWAVIVAFCLVTIWQVCKRANRQTGNC